MDNGPFQGDQYHIKRDIYLKLQSIMITHETNRYINGQKLKANVASNIEKVPCQFPRRVEILLDF